MMIALFFLLLGAIVLLIAAGRIWMNAPRQDSPPIDTRATSTVNKLGRRKAAL